MINGKVWGTNQDILNNPNVSVKYIEIKKGGTCSKHVHYHKYNEFFVIDGELKIETWKKDYDLVDVTILLPKQKTIIVPEEFHRFTAMKDTKALEIYYPYRVMDCDIEREDCGVLNGV